LCGREAQALAQFRHFELPHLFRPQVQVYCITLGAQLRILRIRLPPPSRLITQGCFRYWRLTRGLTIGAQGAIIDDNGRVLLVRHAYRPGWHFPGGGVERRETVEEALARELEEEVGVLLTDKPELFGIYANFHVLPSDHVALFIVRHWHQPKIPLPSREIAEQGFFAKDALPKGINESTHARIRELLDGGPKSPRW
jgi:8-oxo-dGTP pyrophosphatase MutT (NUDIX family)